MARKPKAINIEDYKVHYKGIIGLLIMRIPQLTGWRNNDDFSFDYNDEKRSITIISRMIPEVTHTRENLYYPYNRSKLDEFIEEFLVKYIKAVYKGSELDEIGMTALLGNFRFMFGNE